MATPPGDIILEPNEKVLIATRPLYLWEPLLVLVVALLVAALYVYGLVGSNANAVLAGALVFVAVLLLVWMFVRWLPWRAKWFVLTDRRVIARWGVLSRNQAALLLDRVQDVSLTRPFPLSMVRDYGTVHIESAGEHAEERISGGLDELDMTNATAFYRALTDAQSKP